jgi:4,5-DOPA dioxygenase extradiol
VLLVSAHYEERHPAVLASPPGKLLYDYYGFPPASYQLRYAPPGDAALGDSVARLLK